MTDIGWDSSAPGWLAAQGETGDATRRFALDAPMLAGLPEAGRVLDIGCGEGRFCRIMRGRGLKPVGLDPTAMLISEARARDPAGSYVEGRAESLPFEAAAFDAVAFYLSLIDIPDFRTAITEAARVLRPGGRLLVANLHAHVTARPRGWVGEGSHWVTKDGKRAYLALDDMMEERTITSGWGKIRIENHHRPLSAYMGAFLGAGLRLTAFEDPPFTGPEGHAKDSFTRVPWAFFMAWQKP